MTLRIRKWEVWQSYRKGRGQPSWIKVHRSLMRDVNWVSLTDAQRGQLVGIWLLAADHHGTIPSDPTVIRKLCFMETEPDLKAFINLGFIDGRRQPDAKVATSGRQRGANVAPTRCQHDATEEKRIEEKRKETTLSPNGDVAPPRPPKEDNDIQKIVKGWKLLNGIPTEGPDSQAWDQVHFPRHAKSAKSLLTLFGDWQTSVRCMEHVFDELTRKKLTCTIETVVKHSDLFREQMAGVGQ